MESGDRRSASDPLASACAVAHEAGFAACAIAPRAALVGAPAAADPGRLVADYTAVVVFAAARVWVVSSGPYGPALLEPPLAAALTRARRVIEEAGHRCVPVAGGEVSLPRAAAAAGIGEVSPVGALVARGHGLSLTLFGFVTDAPLALGEGRGETDPPPASCRDCGLCVDDCPACLPGVFDGAWCTGCGVCVAVCPA